MCSRNTQCISVKYSPFWLSISYLCTSIQDGVFTIYHYTIVHIFVGQNCYHGSAILSAGVDHKIDEFTTCRCNMDFSHLFGIDGRQAVCKTVANTNVWRHSVWKWVANKLCITNLITASITVIWYSNKFWNTVALCVTKTQLRYWYHLEKRCHENYVRVPLCLDTTSSNHEFQLSLY